MLLKHALSSNNGAEEENEPPKKKPKRSLSDTEIDKISSGKKLSDLSIDFAQELLKKQFPGVNGLQSTLYQYKPKAISPSQRTASSHSQPW